MNTNEQHIAPIQLSQIGGAVVRLLTFHAGDLGSTPQSEYKYYNSTFVIF